MHKCNIAVCTIHTFKNHLIAIWARLDDSFPLHQWDLLILQVLFILNLLRQLNVAPHVLAYMYHHGKFDYNQMPLALLGCAVQFHVKPKNWASWGEHSMDSWFVWTSPKHYQCDEIFIKATWWTRISDAVFFKHKYITQPTVTPADAIIKALQDMTQALEWNFDNKGTVHMQAINKMQEVFQSNAVEKWRVKVKPAVQTPRMELYMILQLVHAPQIMVVPPSPPNFPWYLPRASLQLKLKALQTESKQDKLLQQKPGCHANIWVCKTCFRHGNRCITWVQATPQTSKICKRL